MAAAYAVVLVSSRPSVPSVNICDNLSRTCCSARPRARAIWRDPRCSTVDPDAVHGGHQRGAASRLGPPHPRGSVSRHRWAPRTGRGPRRARHVVADGGRSGRLRVVAVAPGADQALVIAQRLEPTGRCSTGSPGCCSSSAGVGGALAALAGTAVGRTGLRPVARLTAATERVARTDDLRTDAGDGQRRTGPAHREFQRDADGARGIAGAAAPARRRRRTRTADAAHVAAHQHGVAGRVESSWRAAYSRGGQGRTARRRGGRRSRNSRSWWATSWSSPARTRPGNGLRESRSQRSGGAGLERARRRAATSTSPPSPFPGSSTATHRAGAGGAQRARQRGQVEPTGEQVRVAMRPTTTSRLC